MVQFFWISTLVLSGIEFGAPGCKICLHSLWIGPIMLSFFIYFYYLYNNHRGATQCSAQGSCSARNSNSRPCIYKAHTAYSLSSLPRLSTLISNFSLNTMKESICVISGHLPVHSFAAALETYTVRQKFSSKFLLRWFINLVIHEKAILVTTFTTILCLLDLVTCHDPQDPQTITCPPTPPPFSELVSRQYPRWLIKKKTFSLTIPTSEIINLMKDDFCPNEPRKVITTVIFWEWRTTNCFP